MEGNAVNDTYYCTDMKCKYTWDGTAWYQSSLNESEYQEELTQLANANAELKNDLGQLYDGINDTRETMELTPLFKWINGSFGSQYDSLRLIPENPIPVKKGTVININPNGQYIYNVFATLIDGVLTKNIYSDTTWSNEIKTIEVERDMLYIPQIANGETYDTSTAISPSDVAVRIIIKNNTPAFKQIKLLDDVIGNEIEDENFIENMKWIRGTFDLSTNIQVSSEWNRLMMENAVEVEKGTVIVIEPNGQYYMYSLTTLIDGTDSSLEYSKSWESEKRIINVTEKCYFRLMVANGKTYEVSTDMSPTDIKLNCTVYKNKVFDIERNVTALQDYIGANNRPLPKYWQEYMESKIDTLINLDVTIGNNGDSFVFITDPHILNNEMWSPLLTKMVLDNTEVGKVVCGGDVIHEHHTKDEAIKYLSAWKRAFNFTNMVTIKGNHDRNTVENSDGTTYISDSEYYGIMLKSAEMLTNTHRKNYFYIDNESQKIRYIFMDSGIGGSMADEQMNWLEESMLSLSEEWGIIIFQHMVFVENNTFYTTGQQLVDAINSIYSSIKATIICVVSGHCHYDYEYETDNGYHLIATTCDSIGSQLSSAELGQRTCGNTTEQAFDVFHIDTKNRKIYITRIGYGSNRVISY